MLTWNKTRSWEEVELLIFFLCVLGQNLAICTKIVLNLQPSPYPCLQHAGMTERHHETQPREDTVFRGKSWSWSPSCRKVTSTKDSKDPGGERSTPIFLSERELSNSVSRSCTWFPRRWGTPRHEIPRYLGPSAHQKPILRQHGEWRRWSRA